MMEFFKNGGVFYFDEDDAQSERSYYMVEELMGEEEGQDITEAYIDEDGEICVYYDASVLSEDQAIAKFNDGDYVKHL